MSGGKLSVRAAAASRCEGVTISVFGRATSKRTCASAAEGRLEVSHGGGASSALFCYAHMQGGTRTSEGRSRKS